MRCRLILGIYPWCCSGKAHVCTYIFVCGSKGIDTTGTEDVVAFTSAARKILHGRTASKILPWSTMPRAYLRRCRTQHCWFDQKCMSLHKLAPLKLLQLVLCLLKDLRSRFKADIGSMLKCAKVRQLLLALASCWWCRTLASAAAACICSSTLRGPVYNSSKQGWWPSLQRRCALSGCIDWQQLGKGWRSWESSILVVGQKSSAFQEVTMKRKSVKEYCNDVDWWKITHQLSLWALMLALISE